MADENRHQLSQHLDAIRAAGLGEHVDAIEALLRYWWIDGYYSDSSRDTCRCGLSGDWEPMERLHEEDRLARGQFTSEERRLKRVAAITDEGIDAVIASYPDPVRSAEERRENMRRQRVEAREYLDQMGITA